MTNKFNLATFIITELLKFTGAIYIFKLTYEKFNNELVFQIGTILVALTLYTLISKYVDHTHKANNA